MLPNTTSFTIDTISDSGSFYTVKLKKMLNENEKGEHRKSKRIIDELNVIYEKKKIFDTEDSQYFDNIDGWYNVSFRTNKKFTSGFIETKKDINLILKLNSEINLKKGFKLIIVMETIKGYVFN